MKFVVLLCLVSLVAVANASPTSGEWNTEIARGYKAKHFIIMWAFSPLGTSSSNEENTWGSRWRSFLHSTK